VIQRLEEAKTNLFKYSGKSRLKKEFCRRITDFLIVMALFFVVNMLLLDNFTSGQWAPAGPNPTPLLDAVHGHAVAGVDASNVDLDAACRFARDTGSVNLRRMTFQQRGLMLKALALHLMSNKEKIYAWSAHTGATRSDSWIDIEGGIGTMFAYASLRKQLPDLPYLVDGDPAMLSKGGSFIGHHIGVPKRGVAIHINAYNFPIWGMLEKVSVNLLAGVPAIVKPASLTSYVAHAMVKEIVASGILPEGSLQLVCGSARGILDHVEFQDVVTFTGSATTGNMLKAHPRVMSENVPFNLEADSLNSMVLGPDAAPGTPEFDLFVKELRKELTIKCGQRCTAVRRAMVPENHLEAVRDALKGQLERVQMGDPANDQVRMGALAGLDQRTEVEQAVQRLMTEAEPLFDLGQPELIGANALEGAFYSPRVLTHSDPLNAELVHEVEPFGPVSCLLPYRNLSDAIELVHKGKGSLCCSIVTANKGVAREFVVEAATHHGRILVLDAACAKESTGHGSPMPQLVHGGPGRAGGGEEMGGLRGLGHYLQRTAIQGHPDTITEITSRHQPGASRPEATVHPFRLHFEDLVVGMTYTTHRHTVTESDIVNFANVSGDNFYAHVDETALEGTIFEKRVAHGYWVLSKAAGMFVSPHKGPVLLNYGLESCRFTKPVYPGMTIGVKLTVEEKVQQEWRGEDDVLKGIVKFKVDVTDETNETVAIATILTMVKNKNQPSVSAASADQN
jgi:oxepin-CoA hydrolase/3-oxo-5,6-dehydrosuberyl-CoA semialdehyde dehydrogenase